MCRDCNPWPGPPAHPDQSDGAHWDTLSIPENNLLPAPAWPLCRVSQAERCRRRLRDPCGRTMRDGSATTAKGASLKAGPYAPSPAIHGARPRQRSAQILLPKMLPGRRKHPQIGRASAALLGESSPYRRSQHTFVSNPEILLGRHGRRAGSKSRFRASGRLPGGLLPTTSFRTRRSARSQIWLRRWLCRRPACRTELLRLFLPACSYWPSARPAGSTECRLPPRRSLRTRRPQYASRNPPGVD